MGGGGLRIGCPVVASPVNKVSGWFCGHAFPPDVSVISFGNVGENTVFRQTHHRVSVGVHPCSGCNTEKTCFWINSIELAVITKFHPTDVITDRLNGPAWNGGDHHGQIGFATGAWKGSSDVL